MVLVVLQKGGGGNLTLKGRAGGEPAGVGSKLRFILSFKVFFFAVANFLSTARFSARGIALGQFSW